ncbi:MAG TPA: glycosyltransferase family 39 protein, partial [Verrucomicrobiae bacterium]|nr:glycosyltransferase family 39 protein [Verrucomicrobiae bacterium]
MTEARTSTFSIASADDPETIRFLPGPRQFFLILAVYLGIQCLARSLLSEAAGIDEAYQVMVGQKLLWGYGPHAPLYTWLMIGFLKLFGSSTLALNLLRETLLFGIYAFTYLNARELTRSHALGIAAAALLQFHPTIVWESQRELTNSLAASCTILAGLYCFLRAREGSWLAWVGFGFCGGLMALSKYNAALYFVALLLAAFSLPSVRQRLRAGRVAAAVLISLLIVAPNLWWVATHRDLAFQLVWKFGIHESMPWTRSVARGLKNWFESAAAHTAPVILVSALLCGFPVRRERPLAFRTEGAKLLARTLLIICLMAIGSVLFIKVTEFKDRWLQPLFITLPVLLILIFRESLTTKRLKLVLGVALLVSVGVGFASSGRLLFTEQRGRRDVLNAPFRALARDLAPELRSRDFLVSNYYWLAGNLHLWFPEKPAFSCDLINPAAAQGNRCLVAWEVGKKDAPPAEAVAFAREFTGQEVLPPVQYKSELWKYHKRRMM